MEFIPTTEAFKLHSDSPRFVSKEHDIHLRLTDRNWMAPDQRHVVDGRLAAGMCWRHTYPQNCVIVSPVCFVSFRGQRLYEVKLSLPHALAYPEEGSKRINIFSSPCVSSNSPLYSPGGMELTRVSTADIVADPLYVSFTTIVKNPTVFVVGVSMAPPTIRGIPPPISYPLLPLRCCLYVACPADRDQYLPSVDIEVYVGLSLKTVDQVNTIT